MEQKTNINDSFLKGLFSRNEIIFGICFFIVFLFTFTLLYIIGLIPKEFASSASKNPSLIQQLEGQTFKGITNTPVINPAQKEVAEPAIRLEAPSISLKANIQNPGNTDYRVLDSALLRGAVHYPGSGDVLNGNMFIFGHSTGYRLVNNPAYQIFNNIKLLKPQAEIYIYTNSKKYVYKVTNVRLVDSRESLVQFSNDKRMLTLSTCNSFGAKTDRYIVEAVFDHTLDI
jgi:LPXTG-site transpeptidase (sortase) family protein